MIAKTFIDTNVLVYAASRDAKNEFKRLRAHELLGSDDVGLSAQVLQEFFVVMTRKVEHPLSAAKALEFIDQLSLFPCQPIDHRIVRIAIEYSQRYQISYWDAALISAAEALGAKVIYSEDLNHGQKYSSVTVENPFVRH